MLESMFKSTVIAILDPSKLGLTRMQSEQVLQTVLEKFTQSDIVL